MALQLSHVSEHVLNPTPFTPRINSGRVRGAMETLGFGYLALAARSHAQAYNGGRMDFLRADPGAHFAQRMRSSAGTSMNLPKKMFSRCLGWPFAVRVE